MSRAIILVLTVAALWAPIAHADPTIHLSVTTDKGTYAAGETVHWTVWASTSVGDTAGVALLSVILGEANQETLSPALTETVITPDDQLLSTDFGLASGFLLASPGVADTDIDGTGFVADITVFQMPGSRLLDQCSDGESYRFAVGSFTATQSGENTLSVQRQRLW